MIKMRIDNQHTLEHALHSGINLFVGAGFSVMANSKSGKRLPIGDTLRNELSDIFHQSRDFSLPQMSTILEATVKEDFYEYLTNRFTVNEYDPIYDVLTKCSIRNVYTTNVDDLIPQIYAKSIDKYLHWQINDGPAMDGKAVNYMPLHGSVSIEPHHYVFDVAALANIHNDVPRIWSCLSRDMETYPTLFLGYGFGDSSVIQTVTSQKTFHNARKEMWILLRSDDQKYASFFEAMGFSIIYGDVQEFLQYISGITSPNMADDIEEERCNILKAYMVPRNIHEVKVQRPVKDFYGGSSPVWSDILSNQIYKTRHFKDVQDSIYTPNKNTIIIGAPVTGKTTLLMQTAIAIKDCGIKLFFESLSKERAEFILKILNNDKAVIFIDNIADCVDAIKVLEQASVKLICAERSHNYGIISHHIDEAKYNVYNVSSLSDQDIQGIYDSLPSPLRNDTLSRETNVQYGRDTLYEFVIRNVNLQNIRERYSNALKLLEKNDEELAEFLVLCAYMHNCHVPLSSEMAYDYFIGVYGDDVSYDEIFDLRSDASDIIMDYIPIESPELYVKMDYYYPRSRYIAEVILESCSKDILARVLENFISCVSKYRICEYRTFRKYAFDKWIVIKAFDDWHRGKAFYEKAFLFDGNNPYVLQQGALYLSHMNQHAEAFEWIDRAISMTNDKYFSIRNSHAIILFNANTHQNSPEARKELQRSMSILEKCMTADSRKRFHAYTYGSQAIRYYEMYPEVDSINYIRQAHAWIKKELEHSEWDIDLKKVYDRLSEILHVFIS